MVAGLPILLLMKGSVKAAALRLQPFQSEALKPESPELCTAQASLKE